MTDRHTGTLELDLFPAVTEIQSALAFCATVLRKLALYIKTPSLTKLSNESRQAVAESAAFLCTACVGLMIDEGAINQQSM